MQLLVLTRAQPLAFNSVKLLQHPGLSHWRETHVGHRIQDVVFFEDVLGQQGDVVAGVGRNRHCRLAVASLVPGDGLGQALHVTSSRIVLQQHHADGAASLGDARRLHRREEHVFFFAVMAPIGEEANELQALLQMLCAHRLAGVELLAHAFQDAEHQLDGLMLFLQLFGWCHDFTSLRNLCGLPGRWPPGSLIVQLGISDFGVEHGPAQAVIVLLQRLLEAVPMLRVQIIVADHPPGAATAEDAKRMRRVQPSHGERIQDYGCHVAILRVIAEGQDVVSRKVGQSVTVVRKTAAGFELPGDVLQAGEGIQEAVQRLHLPAHRRRQPPPVGFQGSKGERLPGQAVAKEVGQVREQYFPPAKPDQEAKHENDNQPLSSHRRPPAV